MNAIINTKISEKFLRMSDIGEIDNDITIRAGDIGYGYVKYCNGVDKKNNLILDSFPALAALTPTAELKSAEESNDEGFSDELGGFGETNFFTKRNTKTIDFGGTKWEVGPDIEDLISSNDMRTLHDNYVKSEQWKILFAGMLAYMEADVIDYLILGLPVKDSKLARYVKEYAEGVHEINGRTVTVKTAHVIPQPLGSLYNYAINNNEFERFLTLKTVVLDPGYYTFDYQTSVGFSVNSNKSGSRVGGMSNILHTIKESIRKQFDDDFDDIEQIDRIIRQPHDPKVDQERMVTMYGKETPLTPHIKNSGVIIDNCLTHAAFNIGSFKDINVVVLAGGPSRIFEKKVRDFLPKHEIIVLNDIFSNVIGFFLWGTMVAIGTELTKEKKQSK